MKSDFSTVDALLERLKSGATPRAQKSLELIHEICKEQMEKGNEISVATIGRISGARGGPSTQPIRNRSGERYRALIEAWKELIDASVRKSIVRPHSGVAEDVLDMIPDAAVRALVGTYIAHNRKLVRENSLLKGGSQIVLDRRAKNVIAPPSNATVEVVAPLENLLPAEIEALQHAISDEFMKQMGWKPEPNGRVNDKRGNRPIYGPGYVNAIKKVLDAVKHK
ncbi:gamma-mobile-trio protein GmtX [Noviherbaspirillum pedocola]|uniref:Uncharacterized protein n=1 Tax=Noviherbaspirillum pedocola TaxID=2801341 RepID=A0A934SSZ5_9BURK|nr:gamma-mobile-trio protein GmtX [Noviherbaspirillum pedocola]MBK4734631.1 hypothetical protein [Noviherbaspirillum pedocola]